MKTIFTASLLLLLVFNNALLAQPGTLDGDFDADGNVTTDFNLGYDKATCIVLQTDGKIILGGRVTSINGDYDFGLVRYNTGGSLDSTFGGNGKVMSALGAGEDYINAMVLQPDGKILVAGYTTNLSSESDIAIVRYNSNGILDSTFGAGGIVTSNYGGYSNIFAMALQSDGKIVVAGETDYLFSGNYDVLVARFNTDGTVDSTFSNGGRVITAISSAQEDVAKAVVIQPDGKIVIAGYYVETTYSIMLIRYNTDGTPDTDFGTGGEVTTDIGTADDLGTSLRLQSDGKLLVGAYYFNDTDQDFVLLRYNADGSPDNSFNGGGAIITDFGASELNPVIAVQPDGKIVLAGETQNINGIPFDDIAVARYNTDGTLDTSFSNDGKVTTDIGSPDVPTGIAVQADGKIVVSGYTMISNDYDFVALRYVSGLNVGVVEFSLAGNTAIYPNPVQQHEVLEYTLTEDATLDIALYDVSGKLVQTIASHQFRSKGANREQLTFDNSLPYGSYFLRITNGDKSASVQVVKQ